MTDREDRGVALEDAEDAEHGDDFVLSGEPEPMRYAAGDTAAELAVADLRSWLVAYYPELESQADGVMMDLVQLSPALQAVLEQWMQTQVLPTVAVGHWTVAKLQQSLGVSPPAALGMLGWLERDYAGGQEA